MDGNLLKLQSIKSYIRWFKTH